MPGIGDKLGAFFAQHRNATIVGGVVVAAGAATVVRKRSSSSAGGPAADGTGYPATYASGGTVPTYDTTASDTASAFGDALELQRQYTDDGLSSLRTYVNGQISAVKKATAPRPKKKPHPPKPKPHPPVVHHKKQPPPRKVVNPRRPRRPVLPKKPIRSRSRPRRRG